MSRIFILFSRQWINIRQSPGRGKKKKKKKKTQPRTTTHAVKQTKKQTRTERQKKSRGPYNHARSSTSIKSAPDLQTSPSRHRSRGGEEGIDPAASHLGTTPDEQPRRLKAARHRLSEHDDDSHRMDLGTVDGAGGGENGSAGKLIGSGMG